MLRVFSLVIFSSLIQAFHLVLFSICYAAIWAHCSQYTVPNHSVFTSALQNWLFCLKCFSSTSLLSHRQDLFLIPALSDNFSGTFCPHPCTSSEYLVYVVSVISWASHQSLPCEISWSVVFLSIPTSMYFPCWKRDSWELNPVVYEPSVSCDPDPLLATEDGKLFLFSKYAFVFRVSFG